MASRLLVYFPLCFVFLVSIGVLFDYYSLDRADDFGLINYSIHITNIVWLRLLLLSFLMLFGMAMSIIHEEYIQSKQKQPFKETLKSLANPRKIILPVLLSPIVFYSVYLITSVQPDDVIALLLAFQNGFFWQKVVQPS